MSLLARIPDSIKRLGKWAGYVVFSFVVFVLTAYSTLPRDRIQERLEAEASQNLNADVSSGDFGLTLLSGAGVHASSITLKTRPLNPADKPVRFLVDDLVAHVGIIAAIRGNTDLSFTARAAQGALDGTLRLVPGAELAVTLEGNGFVIKEVPAVAQAIGLPVDGTIDLKTDLTLDKGLVSLATGRIEVACAGCAIGDGKAKLTVPGDPMLAQGLTFPRISLGRVAGSIVVDKGRATLKDFRGHSPDVDVELDGYIELRDPITISPVHLYLRFKPSEALARREDKIELMNQMLGPTARRSDGYLGFSVTGTLSMLIPLPSKEPPPGVTIGGKPSASVATQGTRPNALPVRTTTFTPPPPFQQPRVAEPQQMPVVDVPEGGPNVGSNAPPPSPSQPMQLAPPNAVPPPFARFGGQLRNILPSEGMTSPPVAAPPGPPPGPSTVPVAPSGPITPPGNPEEREIEHDSPPPAQ